MNMHGVSKSRKTESGAELLARLNTRPNMQSIDSFIFGDSISTSSRAPTSSVSSCGQLIEINGPEGVGKTEFALHCAAIACLPIRSKGVELNGLGSKVIYVDTHHKFSILRFSVILEKEIKHVLQFKRSATSSDSCSKTNSCENDSEGAVTCTKREQPQYQKRDKRDTPQECEYLSNTDMEEIMNESLDRLFVLKVSNSLELVASLITLEKSVSEDHLYSLLVIDKISSFCWIDKSNESSGLLWKENTMAYVSRAVSRLVSQFGITCLALSASLISGKKKVQALQREPKGGKSKEEDTKNFCGTNEYLGKSWVSIRTKKIFFSKKQQSCLLETEDKSEKEEGLERKLEESNVISAVCCLSKTEKCYVFKDNFMAPLL